MGNANAKKPAPRPRQERKKLDLSQLSYGLRVIHTARSIPLTTVDVEVTIYNIAAHVVISQTYVNDETVPIEAVFSFPMTDPNMALCELNVIKEGVVIKAEIQDKEDAFNKYDDTIAEGHGAYLVERNNDTNEYALSVGNLAPGKEIKVQLSYITLLEDVNDDGSIKQFALHSHMLPAHSYNMKLRSTIEMTHEIEAVTCNSHEDVVIDAVAKTLEWQNQHMRPLKENMVFQIKIKDPHASSLVVQRLSDSEQKYAAILTFTPKWEGDDAIDLSSLNEFVFMIDRSGSMFGDKMKAAINSLTLLLHSLPTNSLFNIVSFGSNYSMLFPRQSQLYNDWSISRAQKHIDNMEANMGGTNLLAPLKAILKNRQQQQLILFIITDGESEDSREMIELIKSHNNTARVFAVGIGNECDKNMVEEIARAGKGAAAFVDSEMYLEEEVMRLLRLALRSRLTKTTIDWGNVVDEGQFPATEFAQRAGERITVFKFFSINDNVNAEGEKSTQEQKAQESDHVSNSKKKSSADVNKTKEKKKSDSASASKKRGTPELTADDSISDKKKPSETKLKKRSGDNGDEVSDRSSSQQALPKSPREKSRSKKGFTVSAESDEEVAKEFHIEPKGVIIPPGRILHVAVAWQLIRYFEKVEKEALARGDDSEAETAKTMIKQLGLKYQLPTNYTSLVAVEEREEAVVGEMRKVDIPSARLMPLPPPPPPPRVPVVHRMPRYDVGALEIIKRNRASKSKKQSSFAPPRADRTVRTYNITNKISAHTLSQNTDYPSHELSPNQTTFAPPPAPPPPPGAFDFNYDDEDSEEEEFQGEVNTKPVGEAKPEADFEPSSNPEQEGELDIQLRERDKLATIPEIASLQMANGRWTAEHAANLLLLETNKLKEAARVLFDKHDSDERINDLITAFATALVVHVLTTRYSKESTKWLFMVEKARKFINSVAQKHKCKTTSVKKAAQQFAKGIQSLNE